MSRPSQRSDDGGAYHSISCCEGTRKVEALFARYAAEKAEVVRLLGADPKALVARLWEILAVDRECLFNMGACDPHSFFVCAQCSNLKRLIDFRAGGRGAPFTVECGPEAGRRFVAVGRPLDELSLRLAPGAAAPRVVVADPFTSELLVSWIVESHMRGLGLPHFGRVLTGFVCRDTGFLLAEFPTLGGAAELANFDPRASRGGAPPDDDEDDDYEEETDEEDEDEDQEEEDPDAEDEPTARRSREPARARGGLEGLRPAATPEAKVRKAPGEVHPSVASGVALQLASLFRALGPLRFVHGDPSAHCLRFETKPCAYKIDGVVVSSPVTLYLADFERSSAATAAAAILPRSAFADLGADRSLAAGGEDGETFRISGESRAFYNRLRQGRSALGPSVDLYCVCVSLATIPGFWQGATLSPTFRALWAALWPGGAADAREAEERILDFQHRAGGRAASCEDACAILGGLKLAADAPDRLWAAARKL